MWLSILIVIGIVGGIAAALAGIGPVAILLVLLGLVGIGVKVAGGRAGDPDVRPEPTGHPMSSTGGRATGETPQDDETLDTAHAKTGYAHTGQAHMAPDKERTAG